MKKYNYLRMLLGVEDGLSSKGGCCNVLEKVLQEEVEKSSKIKEEMGSVEWSTETNEAKGGD